MNSILVSKDGVQYGPYSIEQINECISEGILHPTDQAWWEGLENWTTLDQVPGITKLPITSPPPFDPKTFNTLGVQCPKCQQNLGGDEMFCGTCGFNISEYNDAQKIMGANVKNNEVAINPPTDTTQVGSGVSKSRGEGAIKYVAIFAVLILGGLFYSCESEGDKVLAAHNAIDTAEYQLVSVVDNDPTTVAHQELITAEDNFVTRNDRARESSKGLGLNELLDNYQIYNEELDNIGKLQTSDEWRAAVDLIQRENSNIIQYLKNIIDGAQVFDDKMAKAMNERRLDWTKEANHYSFYNDKNISAWEEYLNSINRIDQDLPESYSNSLKALKESVQAIIEHYKTASPSLPFDQQQSQFNLLNAARLKLTEDVNLAARSFGLDLNR